MRTEVETLARRDLSDSRLSIILALVGREVLDVRWLGEGQHAKLEFVQRAKDGKERAPTVEEQRQRKEDFKHALALAVKAGAIPRRELPLRPEAKRKGEIQKSEGMPVLPEPKFDKRPCLEGATAAARKVALLERVRAREASGNRAEAKVYNDLRHRISVCDNALTAHSILQSLFARSDGSMLGGGRVQAAATEAEMLRAMCSTGFAMQSMLTLDKKSALEAIELLAKKAAGWFSLEAGVHIPDAKYLRRLPQGSAALALAALQEERKDLEEQLRSVCAIAKRRQQEPRDVPECESCDILGTPVVAPATAPGQKKRLRKKTRTDY